MSLNLVDLEASIEELQGLVVQIDPVIVVGELVGVIQKESDT
jgi:hypothetical protein